jgi:hypothetical protein
MTHHPSPQPANAGPWRLVILDRGEDPKWILATVSLPTDVMAAVLDPGGRYTAFKQTTEWVRATLGHAVELQPVTNGLVWIVHERRPR